MHENHMRKRNIIMNLQTQGKYKSKMQKIGERGTSNIGAVVVSQVHFMNNHLMKTLPCFF